MIAAGSIGAFALTLETRRRERKAEAARRNAPAGPDKITCAILVEIARAGGASEAESKALAAAHGPCEPWPGLESVDITDCGEAFARRATEGERWALLEAAVRLAVAMNATIPPRQYHALQDLSFGLGFHADALARLRARWRFEYADYARMSRPRSADRAAAVSFGRPVTSEEKAALMKILGLHGELERAALVSAYRRLAGAHHPDRFHDQGTDARETAARRFIELTEAYEKLLAIADR
jgi:DnaJ-domain-containing protein 1